MSEWLSSASSSSETPDLQLVRLRWRQQHWAAPGPGPEQSHRTSRGAGHGAEEAGQQPGTASCLHTACLNILNIASMCAVSPPLGEVSAGLVVAAEVAQLPAAQRHHVQEVELHQRGAPGPHLASI